MGATEDIARFVVTTDSGSIPTDVLRAARDGVLDCLGVTLAGSGEPAGRIITDYVREIGGTPRAGVFGHGFKSTPSQAALANGTMAHALDYDDVIAPMSGHPSVPVLPAVLALGEDRHTPGIDILAAYVIGIEVEAKIGSGIGMRHYAAGWHPTSTLGTLGAAAGAARILRLDLHQTRVALGIAASQASGLRQNFGTMTKPFHAGMAARNGVVAATLATRGFTADPDILESRFGFVPVLGGEGEYDLDRMTQDLGTPFALVSPGLEIKPYPCCRFTHRCIDAVLAIVADHRPAPEDVMEVECHTSRFVPQIVIHHRPTTPLEGKFSMEYCMARTLLDGEMRIAQFSDEKVLDPRAQELLRKVHYVHPPEGDRQGRAEMVTVKLRDGRQYSREVLHARGAPENPLSPAELRAKYRDCAGTVLPPESVERSLQLVEGLDALADVTELCDLVTVAGGRVAAG